MRAAVAMGAAVAAVAVGEAAGEVEEKAEAMGGMGAMAGEWAAPEAG